ncbi:hypothetical protein HYU07_03380 [Candidatus Woesearchaeota archaeon]|nr:hypothetical protein [Candidatus Woesearchaeota archaeon]
MSLTAIIGTCVVVGYLSCDYGFAKNIDRITKKIEAKPDVASGIKGIFECTYESMRITGPFTYYAIKRHRAALDRLPNQYVI